ncbi:MAG: GNAT family N-acetyltransferase [Actinobacteria bacterium]|nr:GNAT family N-acetyltransferase [Actinomycetota bacterium]
MLASSPELQSQGLGTILLEAAEAHLVSRGISLVWANARDTA